MTPPNPMPEYQEKQLAGLLPCPFCGAEFEKSYAYGYHSEAGYDITCKNRQCGASVSFMGTPEEAIAAWNRRAPHSTLSHEGSSEDVV